MTSLPTTYLPLTTTFTAPAECTNGPWIYQNVPTTWWKAGGDNVASCFPPGYPFSKSRIIYSPGVCPGGWTSACERAWTRSGSEQNIVSCCPASFTCASTSSVVHDWEDQFGCASSYSVDTAVWKLSANAPFVSSIYQLPVMIVQATTTAVSSTISLASTTLSSAAFVPAATSATATSISTPITPASDHDGGLPTKTMVGVVVGVVVGVALIAILIYILWATHQKTKPGSSDVSLSKMQDTRSPGVHHKASHDYWSSGVRYDKPELDSTRLTEMDAVSQSPCVYELNASRSCLTYNVEEGAWRSSTNITA